MILGDTTITAPHTRKGRDAASRVDNDRLSLRYGMAAPNVGVMSPQTLVEATDLGGVVRQVACYGA